MKKLSERLFAVAAVTSLVAFSVAGCGSGATSGDLPQVQGASRDSSIKDEDGVIKIGIMEDLTGECALLGVQKVHAYQKAIEEINEAGGIDGMPVEMDLVDACSDNTKYQELSRKLILEDKCDVVMGCATSASREAVRPIFEDNNAILFYNNQYEGGVASHNVFCTGLVPEQQVVPLVPTMMETYGKKIYILAADYNFGQITALWFEQEVKNNGGEIVGTEFVPMGTTQFSSTIAKIQDAAPDILVVLAAGSSQTTFFEQWSTSGIKGLPMMTTVNIAQMYEHIQFDPPALANMHVVANYVMELETEDAKAFTEKMKTAYPDDAYFGMEAAASYEGINLYAKAVENAKTTETEAVIAALEEGITLEHMPSGTITMNGDTHHVTKDLVMIRCDENHELHFDASYSQVAPDWLSKTLGINIKESAPNKQYTPLDTN
ncbi:MAG: urea ABC transporter substrate-binding protein [Butyrivibrio sp.]|nr:urea ABC transporter substrate-binding protein [Butyrivibrio sp.]